MTREEIFCFLDGYPKSSYDARKTKNVRFVDQKCTPDIVCFIAECILSTEWAEAEFTKTNLWHTSYFKENTRIVYGKPFSDDIKARKEYDKIASQPLNLLAAAHVLNKKKVKNAWIYSVNNLELLEYIARKERCSVEFLYCYFKTIVSANGIQRYFDEYKENCAQGKIVEAHTVLYHKFRRFIKANSKVTKDKEPDRMLHKILNIFAYTEGFEGSSRKKLTLSDLLYNKINSRDKKKNKGITRQEANSKEQIDLINRDFFINYQVEKAKNKVKGKQGDVSEIHDDMSSGKATCVHHIFPKSEHPQLAAFFENLILLTPNQHYLKAHPNNKTQEIDREYQLVCLLSKSQTIEKYLSSNKDDFYSRVKFIEVVNTGLKLSLEDNLLFDDIRIAILEHYNYTC